MIKNSRNQNGSAHIVIVVAIVAVLLGAVGYVFWQNFNNQETASKKTETVTTEDDAKKEDTDTVKQQPYLLQDAIDDIYKELSDGACRGSGIGEQSLNFTQAPEGADFTGKNVISQDLTHAYVVYGCGSQAVVALLTKDEDSWTLLDEGARIYPMCSVVRGQNFPSSVVDKCFENDNSTEPVNI